MWMMPSRLLRSGLGDMRLCLGGLEAQLETGPPRDNMYKYESYVGHPITLYTVPMAICCG